VTSTNGQYTIDLHRVEKTYRGKVRALRGVSMQVHKGEVFGLLGPNGAGKSTLVKIMMTVVRPTHAEGTMLGHRIGQKAPLARVGYLPEHHKLPKYLTGAQALDFYASLAGVNRATRRRRRAELLSVVGMSDWANKKVSTYSKGMQQRIGLAQALMNDPELVVLDEPTDGVDPVGRRDIRDVLVRLRDQGKTVFLNSHLLSELEMICNRVAILVQGIVAMQGSIEDLTRESQRYEIVHSGSPIQSLQLDEGSRVEMVGSERSRIVIAGIDPAKVQGIIDQLRREQRVVLSVEPKRETLEDLFMRAIIDPSTGKELLPGAPQGRMNGGAKP
jgi:ABC-2 type transport system ATP-binding protein